MVAKRPQPLLQHHPLLMGSVLAVVVGIAIAGCRPSAAPPTEGLTPAPPAPTDSATQPPTSQPSATQPPTSAVEAAPDQTPAAPSATPSETLPDALIHEWQPLSNVLLVFGPMTLTPTQVQWGSGQTSAYTLVGTEGGYLLKLESDPSFYDTQNQYIKLMPEVEANGTITSMEIAFYTDEAQLQNDDYIMYGSYFIE